MDLQFHTMALCYTTPAMKIINLSAKAGGGKPHVLTACGLDLDDASVIDP